MLTQDELKELLSYDKDTGFFYWRKDRPGMKAGTKAGANDNGYVQIMVKNKKYRSHRLAWLYMYGEFAEGMIDHVNRNKKDNRISNLRILNTAENTRNSDRPGLGNKSGMRGVIYAKKNKYKKWKVSFIINKKHLYFGSYEDLEEAKRVCVAKKKEFNYYPSESNKENDA